MVPAPGSERQKKKVENAPMVPSLAALVPFDDGGRVTLLDMDVGEEPLVVVGHDLHVIALRIGGARRIVPLEMAGGIVVANGHAVEGEVAIVVRPRFADVFLHPGIGPGQPFAIVVFPLHDLVGVGGGGDEFDGGAVGLDPRFIVDIGAIDASVDIAGARFRGADEIGFVEGDLMRCAGGEERGDQ